MKIYVAQISYAHPSLFEAEITKETPKYYYIDRTTATKLLPNYVFIPIRINKDNVGVFFKISEALNWLYTELGIEGGRLQKKLNTIDEYREEILTAVMKLEDEK